MFKSGGVLCAVVLLAACGPPQPRSSPVQPGRTVIPAGPGVFRIDSAASELRVLVHRAGPMARLGHNHVITDAAVTGWVKYSGNAATAAITLSVPVAAFVIDDARMRAAEGSDFTDEVPDDARAGTRRNMLGAALLDAEHYPSIELKTASVIETPDGLVAHLRLSIAGHEAALAVPFAAEIDAGRIVLSGQVDLRQTAMGLTPFSVMLGALQVQDELTVKFHLVAVTT